MLSIIFELSYINHSKSFINHIYIGNSFSEGSCLNSNEYILKFLLVL